VTLLKQAHSAHALALVSRSEDDVVDHGDVNRFGGAGEGAGGATVGAAWGRIAAGVIMGKQNAGAAKPSRIRDNLAHWQADASLIAFGIAPKMDATRAIIDMGDPQHFGVRGVRTDEASRKKVSRGIVAGKQSRGFGALNLHVVIARPARAGVHRNLLRDE